MAAEPREMGGYQPTNEGPNLHLVGPREISPLRRFGRWIVDSVKKAIDSGAALGGEPRAIVEEAKREGR